MKLIILSAGKGTRFLPLTKTIPKALIPIKGKALIDWVLLPYTDLVQEIIFVINEDTGHKLKEYMGINYHQYDIKYVVQSKHDATGTMSALEKTRDLLTDTELFCVCNCDDLLDRQGIIQAFNAGKVSIGLTRTTMPANYLQIEIANREMTGFSRSPQDSKDKIEGLYSNGFYVLSSKVFEFNKVSAGKGEFGLPQTLFANLKDFPLKVSMFDHWQPVNCPEDVPKAEEFIEKFLMV